MDITGGDYESCKNMIWKLALQRYNAMRRSRPDVDFDDVLGEGMLIYCRCLKEYDSGKGMKFSTYLFQNLRGRLSDFYKFSVKKMDRYEDWNDKGSDGLDEESRRFEDTIVSPDYDISKRTDELLKEAKKELSYEGRRDSVADAKAVDVIGKKGSQDSADEGENGNRQH